MRVGFVVKGQVPEKSIAVDDTGSRRITSEPDAAEEGPVRGELLLGAGI